MTRWFTRMASTLPPTSRISFLGDYQRLVVPIVQRGGGSGIAFQPKLKTAWRDGSTLLGMSPL